MSGSNPNKGNCLCGSVELLVGRELHRVGVCHCGMCRKWGGSPLMAVECGSDVEIHGDENVRVYESSEWAERGFCGTCGTHLFYRLKDTGEYHVPAGLFADPEEFVLEDQIFIDRKPAFYDFANRTENLTEAEVFAKHAPDSE